jgi:hypothetical protein
MSIDSEAEGKRDETPRTSLYTRANITHIFSMQMQHAMRNTFSEVTSKNQEVDDFLYWLTRHTGLSGYTFLFTA